VRVKKVWLDQHEKTWYPFIYLGINLLDFGVGKESLDQHEETWHPLINQEE
jgi:hypothetical protein